MISFLIPVSRESYKNSLDSILSQNIKYNYEIILCFNEINLYNKIPNYIKMNPDIKILNLPEELWFYSYKSLYESANNKYIYYLEDDDLLLTDFSFLDNYPNFDYYFGIYKNHLKHDIINWTEEILKYKNKSFKKLFKLYKTPKDFYFFQLSQLLIKRDIIKNIPISDNKYNDYYLFKNNPGKIKYINKYFFKQGWDGNNYSQRIKNER